MLDNGSLNSDKQKSALERKHTPQTRDEQQAARKFDTENFHHYDYEFPQMTRGENNRNDIDTNLQEG